MTDKDKRIINKAMIAEMSIQDIIRCLVYNRESLDRVMQSASIAFQSLQEEVIYGESVDDYAD